MITRLYTVREQSARNCCDLFDGHPSDMSRMQEMLRDPLYNPENPQRMLGIDWDLCDRTLCSIKTGYYVGAQWLSVNESAMVVKPKIEGLDFMSMFMKCYDSRISKLRSKFGDIYHVDLDAPPIKSSAVDFEITPLLIAHFVKLVQGITEKGLKKDYVIREETFHGKVKGKLLVGRMVQRMVSTGRQDMTDCRYQDYSVDNTDNRIIKKTLLFAQNYFYGHALSSGCDILGIIRTALSHFEDVSGEVSVQEIKHHRVNPLFREYGEALKVAKMILCRFGYSISNATQDMDRRSVPPFWINMPILFELYVYSMLHERYGKQIDYHLSTYGNEIDFVKYDERLIIDTKYIPSWDWSTNHENIRQLAGYARNVSLRRQIMSSGYDETTILPCLIIYPGDNGFMESVSPADNLLLAQATPIDTYIRFHKMGIRLPLREDITGVMAQTGSLSDNNHVVS